MRLIMALVLSLPLSASTFYVLAGGAGAHTGADWANAACIIPSLSAGDTVYVGNSGGNLADTTTPCAGELTHNFPNSGTSGAHISIKAATTADHGTSTGWSSAYGVDVTPGILWADSWTPSDGLKNPVWNFCGSYYDVQGAVGTTDQSGTFGFHFRSAGRHWAFIEADTNNCSGTPSISNLTFSHTEMDGVEANSTLNNTVAGSGAVYIGSPISTTATVQNIFFYYVFIHDIFNPILSAGNTIGLKFDHGWIETNFSATLEHSNAIQTQASAGVMGINNLTVSNSVFKNIQGTGVIVSLTGPSDTWTIYNNLFYYSSDWDSICEHGVALATCGLSKVVGDNTSLTPLTNLQFYGNTIANIHLKPGHSGADQAGIDITGTTSGSNTAYNNLWYNCTNANIVQEAKITHDYNTWSSTVSGSTTLAAHEVNNGAQASPFANQYSDFHLITQTPNYGAWNPLGSPFNVDFAGNSRVSSRGAYQYVGAQSEWHGPMTMAGPMVVK